VCIQGRQVLFPGLTAATMAGGYAWIPVRDPSLLDFPRCELLLIGAKPEAEGAHRTGARAEAAHVLSDGPAQNGLVRAMHAGVAGLYVSHSRARLVNAMFQR